jgi:hypothetical protein
MNAKQVIDRIKLMINRELTKKTVDELSELDLKAYFDRRFREILDGHNKGIIKV